MSMMLCNLCDGFIDTDEDPESFEFIEGKCVCESCRENHYEETEKATNDALTFGQGTVAINAEGEAKHVPINELLGSPFADDAPAPPALEPAPPGEAAPSFEDTLDKLAIEADREAKISPPITKHHLERMQVNDYLVVAKDQRRTLSQLLWRLKKFWPSKRFVMRTDKRGSFVWRID